jgi:hypothetical protein
MKQPSVTTPRGPLFEEASKAMQEAVAKVIAEHKRHGLTLTVWRDGKVVEITPEEAEAEYQAAKAKHEAAGSPFANGQGPAPA